MRLIRPTRTKVAGIALIGLIATIGILGSPTIGVSGDPATGASTPTPTLGSPEPISKDYFPVPPPPFSDDVFPCSTCHADLTPNLQRRPLTEFHDNIVLNHGPRERWCFDCHNPDNRDVLRLASGEPLPFTESYRLCGQCHGDKLRDWKVGVHGKRTGEWNGKKQYLLCAHCHNPHSPHFAPIAPMPPPVRPENIR